MLCVVSDSKIWKDISSFFTHDEYIVTIRSSRKGQIYEFLDVTTVITLPSLFTDVSLSLFEFWPSTIYLYIFVWTDEYSTKIQ